MNQVQIIPPKDRRENKVQIIPLRVKKGNKVLMVLQQLIITQIIEL